MAVSAALLIGLSVSAVTCRPSAPASPAITPTPTAEEAAAAAAARAPTPPPPPQLQVLKVSGSGEKGKFRVKLQWNGEGRGMWKIKRWTVMRDLTNQTQSMLVLTDQAFEVDAGDPQLIFVVAVCINPNLPPARQLLVEYPGAPQYVLTDEIPHPKVKAVVDTIKEVEAALPQMMSRLRFRHNTVELVSPRGREPDYLQVVVWDQSVEPPRPYLDDNVIEAAVVVASSGGMTAAEYAIHLQRTIPGSTTGETQRLANRIADQVNRLLALAGLSERLRKR
jgi:hypothetical protein